MIRSELIRPAFVLAALLVAVMVAPLRAQESGIFALLPENAVSSHSISLGGKPLKYRAEAGTLPLRDGKGTITAKIFYVAYSLTSTEAPRPVTFVFNGGPGAASSYLHLGGLGPMVLTLSDTGEILPPPPRLIPNEDTWVEFTDLVFVDPVGTGYSRATNPDEERTFWGVEQDAA